MHFALKILPQISLADNNFALIGIHNINIFVSNLVTYFVNTGNKGSQTVELVTFFQVFNFTCKTMVLHTILVFITFDLSCDVAALPGQHKAVAEAAERLQKGCRKVQKCYKKAAEKLRKSYKKAARRLLLPLGCS